MARVIIPFEGWDWLKQTSSNIVIAHCIKPTPSAPGVLVIGAPKSDFGIEVVSVIKGKNFTSAARLWTDHELLEGQNYLLFGFYDSGIYKAYEPYRIVPLGLQFSTNMLAGKTLDEQIQMLLQRRLNDLNRQMKAEQGEKARLEQAFIK